MDKNSFQDLSKNIKNQIEKLEELDVYTNRHIHSVPIITKKICTKLGINEEKIKFYMNCAYLHDIGKIFTPSEILQKSEKLTDEEYEIMKQHTIKGYELCMSEKLLSKYAFAARSHHENENGTGYPDRIKDDEIKIEARIVKVADIYDAICSRRQYKPEVKRIDAMRIIEEIVEDGKMNKKIFNALVDVVIDDVINDNNDLDEIEELNKMKK